LGRQNENAIESEWVCIVSTYVNVTTKPLV
jgi:hypothetical protein